MTLSETVRISGRFLRSTRIDLDSNDNPLDGYVFPASLKELILGLAKQQSVSGQGAFTWTGPYGSGKSSLALVLTQLLSGSVSSRTSTRKCVGDDPFVDAILKHLPPKKNGWKTICMVGEMGSPQNAIARQFKKLNPEANEPLETESDIINALVALANSKPATSGGLILIIDEMGKFLETAATGLGDVYFFQLLAEAASRSDGRLIVIGILHQAFQEYARNLGKGARDEWAKIQGRYVDIPVNISGEEQIELISRAIVSESKPELARDLGNKAAILIRKYKPSLGKSAGKSLSEVWPLNPMTALMLGPISRRSYGQNQRSLFSFLSSSEGHGFQDFLHQEADNSCCYNPSHLWEYLRFNLQSSIAASPDSHHFSNAMEALDRCIAADGTDLELSILKCICLLELTRQQTGVGATDEALALCLPGEDQKRLNAAIKSLLKKSLVIFKQHRGSYGIFEGSDFDIETAIEETAREVSTTDLNAVSSALAVSVISAKRHYHETGTMRWCDFKVAPADQLIDYGQKYNNSTQAFGLVTLVLPTNGESPEELKKLISNVHKSTSKLDHVFATAPSTRQLVLLAKEHSILSHLLLNRREIDRDKVARREIRDRLEAITGRIEQEIWATLNNATWFRKGAKPQAATWAEVNSMVSDLADLRYPKAPRIHNELLNRSKPSGSANGALKLLLHAMTLREGKEKLGFTKYPAEMGLFCSILEANNLYQSINGEWKFVPPEKGDPAHLHDLWTETREYLAKRNDRIVHLTELYDLWRNHPFGVRDGLSPLLAVLFLITERSSLAYYRDGIFLSAFSDVDVDYLMKAPSSIQLRWMNISALSRRLLANLADVAAELTGEPVLNLEPLDVARALISAFENVAPWVHKTSRISQNALKIRNLFKRSRDPNRFLFDDIPSLFKEVADVATTEGTDFVTQQIRDGLKEIQQRYPEMLGQLRDQVLIELQIHTQSPQAIKELNERAMNIQGVSGDFRLDAFIGKLTRFDNSQDAIESLVGLGINKPARNWVDNDVDRAALELLKFAHEFNTLEAFARVKGRKDKRDSMAVVVGMDGRPVPVIREFNVIDSEKADVAKLAMALDKVLKKHKNVSQNIALAALATVSASVIGEEDVSVDEEKNNA